MRYARHVSFKRAYKKSSKERQENIDKAIRSLAAALESGQVSVGLGLKQLRHDFWEIRAGLAERIIFHRHQDIIEFVIFGSHEGVKRFLKRI
ncbi:MAG: hypothetical protein HY747_12250 [Elusimicrobia bacterium]|nr:hypothetical protein [Elusimicrobiota bacterium]